MASETADDELGWLSIHEILNRLNRRELHSEQLTAALLRRIDRLDQQGPMLRSVLSRCPDAQRVARALDSDRRADRRRGSLHGIPILVKDNIDSRGEEGSTAGSLALSATRPGRDAVAVQSLRAAGAIILGKTNLSEWANFRGHHSISGWSAVGGQCRNPHAPERSPSGSSSGSAVAVAAGLVPAAVGTETDGSILSPAAVNGVVGIKPTVGLVSRTGVIPVSTSQDTVGTFGRSVLDAAVVLAVLAAAGTDSGDPATLDRPAALTTSYTAGCTPDALQGRRIGVVRDGCFGYSPKADALVEAALSVARAAGAELRDPAAVPTAHELADDANELTVLLHEFRTNINRYLAHRPWAEGAPRTLTELIAFNVDHADTELALFGQELFISADATDGLEAPSYISARETNLRRARDDGIDQALSRSGSDVLAMPTTSPAWLIDAVNGDAHFGAGYQIAAVAGYPAITIPVGTVSGLPVGICFIGRPWSEAALIAMAYALEQHLDLGHTLRPALATEAAGSRH